jgi:hypothetical protein
MWHKKLTQRRKKALLILALIVGLLALDYYAFPYGASLPNVALKTRTNGLWMRYTHYLG